MSTVKYLSALVITLHAVTAWAAGSSPPQDVAPRCPSGSTLNATATMCKASDEKTCTDTFKGAWKAADKTCDKERAPDCPGADRGISFNAQTKTCQIDTSIPTSSSGAFVGDTLEFVVDGKPAGTVAGVKYCVLGQTTSAPPSIELIMRDEEQRVLPKLFTMFGCVPKKSPQSNESANVPISSLDGTGYARDGWTYGALLLPYKFHTRDNEFSPAGQIGPYVGRSYTVGSFGIKVIGTIAYGPITTNNGNTSAANGTATVKTINGLALGLGLIGTITKGPSPFQFGLVVGRDKVSASDKGAYPYTGKGWIGLQLGYDFTTGS